MALTDQQQAIFDHIKASLPAFFFQDTSGVEVWEAAAVELSAAQTQLDAWLTLSYIKHATGVWLDQHARDRGTFRQNNENDGSLRTRIYRIEDKVTKAALLAATQAVLTAHAITGGPPHMVELRKDRGFFRTATGTGRNDTYLSRGYRLGTGGLQGLSVSPSRQANEFIVILPYGTTTAVANIVRDLLRLNKAGGIKSTVEVRGVP